MQKEYIPKKPLVAEEMKLSTWYREEAKIEPTADAYDNGREIEGYKVWYNKDQAGETVTWMGKEDFDNLFIGV